MHLMDIQAIGGNVRLRIKRESVTVVSNDVIQYSGLSFGALGLFTHLLSLRDSDVVDDDVLCIAGKCSGDELSRYKAELRSARLLIRRPDGNDEIYDDPQEAE